MSDTHPPLEFPEYRSTRLRHPHGPLVVVAQRLTEVTGPLLGEGRVGGSDHDLTVQHAGAPLGERIVVSGRVVEGDGRPVAGSLVEVWQANAGGRYRHEVDRHRAPLDPNFSGAGRCPTDAEGCWVVWTVKPGSLPAPGGGLEAPHLDVSVFARGLLGRLVTRVYFPEEVEANAADPVLGLIGDPVVRARLVAVPEGDGLRFDICLQGDQETPFLAL